MPMINTHSFIRTSKTSRLLFVKFACIHFSVLSSRKMFTSSHQIFTPLSSHCKQSSCYLLEYTQCWLIGYSVYACISTNQSLCWGSWCFTTGPKPIWCSTALWSEEILDEDPHCSHNQHEQCKSPDCVHCSTNPLSSRALSLSLKLRGENLRGSMMLSSMGNIHVHVYVFRHCWGSWTLKCIVLKRSRCWQLWFRYSRLQVSSKYVREEETYFQVENALTRYKKKKNN